MKSGFKKKGIIEKPILYGLFSLVLGMLMGWVGTDLPSSYVTEHFLISMGIYLFIGSLIAFFSDNAISGGLNLFCIFFGKLIGGFLNRYALVGSLNFKAYMYFAIGTAIMFLIGFLLWHSRRDKWVGAFCGAPVIALLIAEAYGFYQVWTIGLIADIAMALILYFVLYNQLKRLMALPVIIVITVLLIYFNFMGKFFEAVM